MITVLYRLANLRNTVSYYDQAKWISALNELSVYVSLTTRLVPCATLLKLEVDELVRREDSEQIGQEADEANQHKEAGRATRRDGQVR